VKRAYRSRVTRCRGGRDPARDLPLVGSDWGFDLGNLSRPVTLFYGSADAAVGPDLARASGDRPPECDLYLGGGAHYSAWMDDRAAVVARAPGADRTRTLLPAAARFVVCRPAT